MRRLQISAAGRALAMTIPLLVTHAAIARADWKDCASTDSQRIIAGCTAILDAGTEATRDIALAYFNRANAYYSRGQYDAAIRDYDRSIALDSQARTYYMRGNAYYGKGDRYQAIKDHAYVSALKPKAADAVSAQGFSDATVGLMGGANAEDQKP